jgi:hypothetical protein
MFAFGAAVGSDPERLRTFLRVWFFGALLYLPLVAIEVRLSPRIHYWIYGYLQHDYLQLVRQGGFRPIVFMHHGLEVALFVAASTSISCALSGSNMRAFGLRPGLASGLLMVMLVLCKSRAALVYGVTAFVMSKFGGAKRTMTVVRLMVLIILLYPMLRLGGWITAETPRSWTFFEESRIESAVFRMMNEDMMLHKALERAWTGWGGFGRISVFDTVTGQTLSVPDGSWIIEITSGGIPRFIAMFGLLTLPALAMKKLVNKTTRAEPKDAKLFAALALTCMVLVLDLIPNGMFNFFSFLVAGVLSGIQDRMKRDPVASADSMSSLARFTLETISRSSLAGVSGSSALPTICRTSSVVIRTFSRIFCTSGALLAVMLLMLTRMLRTVSRFSLTVSFSSRVTSERFSSVSRMSSSP